MGEQDEQIKDRIVARGEISSELDIVPVAHRNGALQVCYRSKILPITPLRCVHPVSSHWQNLMNKRAELASKFRNQQKSNMHVRPTPFRVHRCLHDPIMHDASWIPKT